MKILSVAVLLLAVVTNAGAVERATGLNRAEREALWQARIAGFLDQGVIPIIDFLSFFPKDNAGALAARTARSMDLHGVAVMAVGGYGKSKPGVEGFTWRPYLREVVAADPARLALGTAKGGNHDWWMQNGQAPGSFISQLEQRVRSGEYPFISEIEFRHYMSNAQCKAGKTERDIDIPLTSPNGHRLFKLAEETGVVFSIHLEPEDAPLAALEEMLAAYPKARVIYAHFGQIRHPERQAKFTPARVRRMLAAYPGLHFDISTGEPNRRYKCGADPDTVLWRTHANGRQDDTLAPAWKAILQDFSDRFVAGLDYGPDNRNSADYFARRVENIRLILRDLPETARHDIAYRTGWKLLTGRPWAGP